MALHLPSIARFVFTFIRRAVLLFFVFSIALAVLYSFMPVPATPLMFTRMYEQANEKDRSVRWHKDWVSLEDISPQLQLAVVCAEDQDFLQHEGFDFEAIKKAYKYNKNHKRKRGASTISQQTAKNVFLVPTRSYLRKAFEVYFTFLIEAIWSKERIMEVYLNVIEFGDGIYGAEAASQFFFNKNASQLNRQEAALLASVLPNPLKFSVSKPPDSVVKRQKWVMNQMRYWGKEIEYNEPEPE